MEAVEDQYPATTPTVSQRLSSQVGVGWPSVTAGWLHCCAEHLDPCQEVGRFPGFNVRAWDESQFVKRDVNVDERNDIQVVLTKGDEEACQGPQSAAHGIV